MEGRDRKFYQVWIVAAVMITLGVAGWAHAQQAVQQSPARLDAAIGVQHSHSSAATLIIPAQSGMYIYVTGIDISNCAGSSAVTAAVPTYITTTNLTGSPQYQLGSGVTAGLCQPSPAGAFFAAPLKSQNPGTAVTFVLPTFATNQTVSMNAYYYYNAQ